MSRMLQVRCEACKQPMPFEVAIGDCPHCPPSLREESEAETRALRQLVEHICGAASFGQGMAMVRSRDADTRRKAVEACMRVVVQARKKHGDLGAPTVVKALCDAIWSDLERSMKERGDA